MRSICLFRRLLLLSLFITIITGCSVFAQRTQRAPKELPTRGGRNGQTPDDARFTARKGGGQKVAVVTSPFDSASEARARNLVNSPFSSPSATPSGAVVNSPFTSQSEMASEAGVGSPFISTGEVSAGAAPMNSPFDRSGLKIEVLSIPGTKPDDKRLGDEDAAGRQNKNEADEGKAAPLMKEESSHELFGGSYQPQPSGETSPAFSGAGWAPWYSLQEANGSRRAEVDIAYKAGSVAAANIPTNRPVRWALRNRSKTTLTVEYELNVRCSSRCASGWHGFRAVIPASKSVRGGEKGFHQVLGARVLKAGVSKRKLNRNRFIDSQR